MRSRGRRVSNFVANSSLETRKNSGIKFRRNGRSCRGDRKKSKKIKTRRSSTRKLISNCKVTTLPTSWGWILYRQITLITLPPHRLHLPQIFAHHHPNQTRGYEMSSKTRKDRSSPDWGGPALWISTTNNSGGEQTSRGPEKNKKTKMHLDAAPICLPSSVLMTSSFSLSTKPNLCCSGNTRSCSSWSF